MLCCFHLYSLVKLDNLACRLGMQIASMHQEDIGGELAAIGWQEIQSTWVRCEHGRVCFWHCWQRYHNGVDEAYAATIAAQEVCG